MSGVSYGYTKSVRKNRVGSLGHILVVGYGILSEPRFVSLTDEGVSFSFHEVCVEETKRFLIVYFIDININFTKAVRLSIAIGIK